MPSVCTTACPAGQEGHTCAFAKGPPQLLARRHLQAPLVEVHQLLLGDAVPEGSCVLAAVRHGSSVGPEGVGDQPLWPSAASSCPGSSTVSACAMQAPCELHVCACMCTCMLFLTGLHGQLHAASEQASGLCLANACPVKGLEGCLIRAGGGNVAPCVQGW